MNDINYINYTKRSSRDKQVVTVAIFGEPIDCIDGMMRLKDIQDAYNSMSGESKRIQNWMDNQSTKDLIEYLGSNDCDFYSLESELITVPSRKAGTFACRELAHDFAMWLDKRYAAHVLRTFDQLVQGNFEEAHRTATKVAIPFLKLEWAARKERLIAKDMDPDDYLRYLMEDLYSAVTESTLKDAIDFRNFIYANISESLILERILNSIEMAWKYEDAENAVSIVLEHFQDDPDFTKLIDITKDYYGNNY